MTLTTPAPSPGEPQLFYYVARGGQISGPYPAEQLLLWRTQGMTDAMIQLATGGPWLAILEAELVPSAARPASAAVGLPSKRPRRGFWLDCLHFLRWCCAATLTVMLAVSFCGFVSLRSPIQVIDSQRFWHRFAERSPALQAAHQTVDRWLDSAVSTARANPNALAALTGDRARLAHALEQARQPIHDALSGKVIDAGVGMLSGRDPITIDAWSALVERELSTQLTSSLERELCGPGDPGGLACEEGKLVARADVFEPLLGNLTGQGVDYVSNRLVETLTPLGPIRGTMNMWRGFLIVAPVLLVGLAGLVALFSLRLRTAVFMFGWCAVLSGIGLWLLGGLATWVAGWAGVSQEVWELVIEEAQLMSAGLPLDSTLLFVGALLFTLRIWGPRWRRSFWQRRLHAQEPEIAALAEQRLSRPADLLEPWRVVRTALAPRRPAAHGN